MPVLVFSSALAWAVTVMVITLRLLRLRQSWRTRLLTPAPGIRGLAVIGIRQVLATPGVRATGHGRHILGRTGLGRATPGIVTTADIGAGDYQAGLSFQTSSETTRALPPCA